MKSRHSLALVLLFLVTLLLGTGCANAGQDADSSADYTAPDFTVLDYEGHPVKLSDYRGRPVVLNFWATWCGYCKMEMPDFDWAYAEYPDVQFLMVNVTDGKQETVTTAKAYVEEEGYTFPVFFDTKLEAVNAYGVSAFPTTFFIDAAGQLVTYRQGMLDRDTLKTGIGMIRE